MHTSSTSLMLGIFDSGGALAVVVVLKRSFPFVPQSDASKDCGIPRFRNGSFSKDHRLPIPISPVLLQRGT